MELEKNVKKVLSCVGIQDRWITYIGTVDRVPWSLVVECVQYVYWPLLNFNAMNTYLLFEPIFDYLFGLFGWRWYQSIGLS
jgi:hypothetical protein